MAGGLTAADPSAASVDQGEALRVGDLRAVRHQVITWTLPDRRESAEPALRRVVSTIRETGG